METLETSLETVGITPLSLVDEMETIWKHDTKVETSCQPPIPDRRATNSHAAPEALDSPLV
jgi:hypothetical protein